MFIARLPILVLLYFFFFLHHQHHPVFTLAVDFPTLSPHSPVDNSHCFDNNIATTNPVSPSLIQLVLLVFGRGNAIATVVIIVITILNIIVYNLRKLQEANAGEKLTSSASERLCRRFSLAEILSATNNFDDSLIIGKGGFGNVYKAVIEGRESTVAIKRLNSRSKQGACEFWTEIEMLSTFRHSHLVSLIGYCDIYNEMILVYEYMVHGTIADHLYKVGRNGGDISPISWVQRLKICIGAARGLDYLHTGTGIKHRVIHRDVKSSNILLDENWAARISDFGMSKVGPADQSCTHVSTHVKVLCGRPAVDLSLPDDQRGLARWVQHCIKAQTVDQIIDPNLRGQILSNCLSSFVQTADRCLNNCSKKRPTMAEVVGLLEFALALQERRDSSIVEEEIFNAVEGYDSQEHVESSTEQEVIDAENGEHHDEKIDGTIRLGDPIGFQSPTKPTKRMAFTKKVRFLLSQLISGVVRQVPPSGHIATTSLKEFSFVELKIATNNFSPDMLLEKGGFGNMFIGWVNEKTYAPSKVGIGMAVVIKKVDHENREIFGWWQSKMELFGTFDHPNIVKLLGYCWKGQKLLLVSEYTKNGCLDNYLFRRGAAPLSWDTRLKIAIGATRGLSFLHTIENQLSYYYINGDNIWLDENFNAKLSDFELAKWGPIEFISTSVGDSFEYPDPEYMTPSERNTKSQIYSLGLLLLKILAGLPATFDFFSSDEDLYLFGSDKRKLGGELIPLLVHDYPPGALVQSTALIVRCLESNPTDRPSLEQILKTLEQINALKIEPKDDTTQCQE